MDNNELRECFLLVVSGRKRIGKSNESIRMLYQTYMKSGRKGIIFDPNNEYGSYVMYLPDGQTETKHIKTIEPSKKGIISFSVHPDIEIRRLVPRNKDGTMMETNEVENLLICLIRYFRGGCIMIEDVKTIFSDSLPMRFASLLYNNAHRNSDVILQVQSIGAINPKVWQNANYVRFHRQNDDVEESSEKTSKGKLEIFQLAELIVSRQYDAGNIRYFLMLDLDYKKIKGGEVCKLTSEMVKKAITEYLDLHPEKIRKFMPKFKNNRQRAFIYTFNMLAKKYFLK